MRPNKPEIMEHVVCPIAVQAPVTTAGIGYVVVTGAGSRPSAGPFGSGSSRASSNSPTAESQVRSEVTDAPLLGLASVGVDLVLSSRSCADDSA